MKNSLKFLTIALLAALVLLASFQTPTGRAATTCGQSVSGHTLPSQQPETCTDDGQPVWTRANGHVFSSGQYDHCPYDGQPLVSGHTVPGN